jgi:hypothetical protein
VAGERYWCCAACHPTCSSISMVSGGEQEQASIKTSEGNMVLKT